MIETTSLYNGEITCEFNAAKHSYVLIRKGRRYKCPSVTRITGIVDKSGPLMAWAINNTLDVCKGAIAPGNEYAESYLEAVWQAAKAASARTKSEAASRGTGIHREIESILKRVVSVSESSREANSLVAWLMDVGTVQEIERRIYSRRYRYSGTCDGLVQTFPGHGGRDSQLVLFDWKTGKNLYPEHRLQTAAYCKAYEEEFPDKKIAGRYLVRIAEDGAIEPHFYPRSTLRLDFKGFLGAKALFDRVQQIEKENRCERKLQS